MNNKKRPWFKFNPTDWLADPDLRMCTLESKGLLVDMMSLAHNGKPYGYVNNGGRAVEPEDIARIEAENVDKIRDLLKMLLARNRIKQDCKGFFIPRMVKDGEAHERQQDFGSLGGSPKLADNHIVERDELLAKLSTAFKTLWQSWLADRRTRKIPMTVYAEVLQLKKCIAWGEQRATASIKTSIERGWRGLFESEQSPAQVKRQEKVLSMSDQRQRAIENLVESLWRFRDNDAEFKRCLAAGRDKYKDIQRKDGLTVTDEVLEIIKFRKQNKWGG